MLEYNHGIMTLDKHHHRDSQLCIPGVQMATKALQKAEGPARFDKQYLSGGGERLGCSLVS